MPELRGGGLMGVDTDGTEWRTVVYTVTIDVMADSEEEALYQADLQFRDYPLSDFTHEIKVID